MTRRPGCKLDASVRLDPEITILIELHPVTIPIWITHELHPHMALTSRCLFETVETALDANRRLHNLVAGRNTPPTS